MAEIFQIQAKDSVVKIGNYSALNAIQSFDWDPTFNEEFYYQLGDEDYAGYAVTPEVSGSFEANTTNTVAFLKRMINQFNDPSEEFEGYLAGTPGGASDNNAGLITGRMLENAVFDLSEVKQANETFNRALVLPRAFLSSIALRADANGAASETYSFEGQLAELYRNEYRDTVVYPGVRGATPDTTIDVEANVEHPSAAVPAGDWFLHYIMIDDVKIEASDLVEGDFTAGATTTIDISSTGKTIPLGSRIAVVMYRQDVSALSFPTISNPTTARFVKADDIDIWLVDPTAPNAGAGGKSLDGDVANGGELVAGDLNAMTFADSDLFLRVQNVDMNVDLRREVLRQIRQNVQNTSVFYRAATFPLQVTASATAMETDAEDWAKLQNSPAGGILDLGSFETPEWGIVIRYYKAGTVLQTIALRNARVNGRGSRIAVEGRAEVNWSFQGSSILFDGADI